MIENPQVQQAPSTPALESALDQQATRNLERSRVTVDAAMEIEALALSLIKLSADQSLGEFHDLCVRGISSRIRNLSGIVMCALSDCNQPDVAELREMLLGCHRAH